MRDSVPSLSRVYPYPIATMNQTMALARARLTRARTRSQPFMAYLPHRLLAQQAPAVRVSSAAAIAAGRPAPEMPEAGGR